jgi:hypothetical protein
MAGSLEMLSLRFRSSIILCALSIHDGISVSSIHSVLVSRTVVNGLVRRELTGPLGSATTITSLLSKINRAM